MPRNEKPFTDFRLTRVFRLKLDRLLGGACALEEGVLQVRGLGGGRLGEVRVRPCPWGSFTVGRSQHKLQAQHRGRELLHNVRLPDLLQHLQGNMASYRHYTSTCRETWLRIDTTLAPAGKHGFVSTVH